MYFELSLVTRFVGVFGSVSFLYGSYFFVNYKCKNFLLIMLGFILVVWCFMYEFDN